MAQQPKDEVDVFAMFTEIRQDIQRVDENVSKKIERIYDKIDDLPCPQHGKDIMQLQTQRNNGEKFSVRLEAQKKEGRKYAIAIWRVAIAAIGLALTVVLYLTRAK